LAGRKAQFGGYWIPRVESAAYRVLDSAVIAACVAYLAHTERGRLAAGGTPTSQRRATPAAGPSPGKSVMYERTDPVSSLDDDRRGYIADRLVTEAHTRQVIVLTHDLPFVFDLRTQAKKASVPVHYQHIWRPGDDVGRVDDQPPFKTMNLRQRIGRLDQEVRR
jgi:hypothetical protein